MAGKDGALDRARDIYGDRSRRARQLQAEGKRVIGYPCVYVPTELLTASDLVPYRVYADIGEPVTEADRALPTSFCSIMRGCFDCALKGRDGFLDGVVVAHSCDPQEKTARLWESYIDYPFSHFMDIPGTVRPEAVEYFKGQIQDLVRALEAFTGQRLSKSALRGAVQLHNRQRALVRELYDLTKPDPPALSGVEVLQVVKALMSIPVAEGNDLLEQVIAEAKKRPDGPQAKEARLLVVSSTLDDAEVMEVLEARANVVMDESCGGMRPYRGEVELTGDPLDGLAHYYLHEVTCARTFREAVVGETAKLYSGDLGSRFGYLRHLAEEWHVDGAVILLVRYCDPFGFEVPSLRDYFDSIGIPSTYIEYDYSRGALAPLRTRIEAFVETIG